MTMLNQEIQISETASGGAWSFNTPKLVSCFLKQIIIKADSDDTTFYITITDENNNIVYYTEVAATGTLRQELEIPLKGINTVSGSGASADEPFTGKITLTEH